MESLDRKNINRLNSLYAQGELSLGVRDGNVAITLNDLIEFCKDNGIDFDAPILLADSEGYFPLAYYCVAFSVKPDTPARNLGMLAIVTTEED